MGSNRRTGQDLVFFDVSELYMYIVLYCIRHRRPKATEKINMNTDGLAMSGSIPAISLSSIRIAETISSNHKRV